MVRAHNGHCTGSSHPRERLSLPSLCLPCSKWVTGMKLRVEYGEERNWPLHFAMPSRDGTSPKRYHPVHVSGLILNSPTSLNEFEKFHLHPLYFHIPMLSWFQISCIYSFLPREVVTYYLVNCEFCKPRIVKFGSAGQMLKGSALRASLEAVTNRRRRGDGLENCEGEDYPSGVSKAIDQNVVELDEDSNIDCEVNQLINLTKIIIIIIILIIIITAISHHHHQSEIIISIVSQSYSISHQNHSVIIMNQ